MIPYKWGFSFKLLIDYKGRIVVLISIQAKGFEAELDREDVDVEMLKQGITKQGAASK